MFPVRFQLQRACWRQLRRQQAPRITVHKALIERCQTQSYGRRLWPDRKPCQARGCEAPVGTSNCPANQPAARSASRGLQMKVSLADGLRARNNYVVSMLPHFGSMQSQYFTCHLALRWQCTMYGFLWRADRNERMEPLYS